MNMYELYSKLNCTQRREVQQETERQKKIEDLEAELEKTKKRASIWKSIMCVIAIVVSCVLALN